VTVYYTNPKKHDQRWRELETNHPCLSFAGTKRLLESLILLEDLKKQQQQQQQQQQQASLLVRGVPSYKYSRSSYYCYANLLELDLSGWVLEEDGSGSASSKNNNINNNSQQNKEQSGTASNNGCYYYDEDKVVDNYYDDYNYIDGEDDNNDDFEFDGYEMVGNGNGNGNASSNTRQNSHHGRKRACCVVASMLRVNTTLRRLVLANEGGSNRNYSYNHYNNRPGGGQSQGRRSKSALSVRSTLAIARALRDHVSVTAKHNDSGKRPLGSNLETLVLSTDYYCSGEGNGDASSSSSWAIKERKRAVAKVFYQALRDRPIYQVSLQELSCTLEFRDLEPVGGAASTAAGGGVSGQQPHRHHHHHHQHHQRDLKEQLELLLRKNRGINQSLKRIDSFWIPKLSCLTSNDDDDYHDDRNAILEKDDRFVLALDDADGCAADSTAPMLLPPSKAAPPMQQQQRRRRPPTIVLVLPELLARAGNGNGNGNGNTIRKEAATFDFDTVFGCAKTLAGETNLWEEAARYRCKHPSRYRYYRRHRGGRGRDSDTSSVRTR